MLVDPLFSVGGCYWHDVAGGVGVEWLRGFMEHGNVELAHGVTYVTL